MPFIVLASCLWYLAKLADNHQFPYNWVNVSSFRYPSFVTCVLVSTPCLNPGWLSKAFQHPGSPQRDKDWYRYYKTIYHWYVWQTLPNIPAEFGVVKLLSLLDYLMSASDKVQSQNRASTKIHRELWLKTHTFLAFNFCVCTALHTNACIFDWVQLMIVKASKVDEVEAGAAHQLVASRTCLSALWSRVGATSWLTHLDSNNPHKQIMARQSGRALDHRPVAASGKSAAFNTLDFLSARAKHQYWLVMYQELLKMVVPLFTILKFRY